MSEPPGDPFGPYRRLDSREVYRNPWIRVREDRIVRPAGGEGIYGVVSLKAGSSVLAIDDAGRALLVREYKYALERDSLEVVSGGIDEGESPLDAARRELAEELGATAAEWIPAGTLHPFTTVVRSENHMFVARGLAPVPGHAPDPDEPVDIVRVPLAEAVAMVERGEIVHGASCVLLLRAARRFVL